VAELVMAFAISCSPGQEATPGSAGDRRQLVETIIARTIGIVLVIHMEKG
jgi:hypothetical protein